MEPTRWRAWGRYVVVAIAAIAISGFAFVLRRPVPIFDWIDLGVHELGHMLVPSPRMLHFLAGSLAQVLLPVGFAIYFFGRQRDPAAGGFCLAWAGTSAWDVSVYIADARVQELPLVGGGMHDWAYLLGPDGWGALDRTESIAGFVDVAGMILAGLGIGAALRPALRNVRARARAARAHPVRVREARASTDPSPGDPREAPAAATSRFAREPEDPWIAASRLPFFTRRPGNRSR
jgi:hypothetical protein